MTDPTQMTAADYLLVTLAAIAAGAVNAIAGGGTLITFPTLTAVGLPTIAANITNTVALAPGYLSATLAQSRDLGGQNVRLWLCLPVAALGGIAGGILLLATEERVFRSVVPFLILLASGLLAVQGPIRTWLSNRPSTGGSRKIASTSVALAVGAAGIYGGYFGAGLSVIVLAVLGLLVEDSMTRLNALKQAIAFAVNVAAATFFLFSGQVIWSAALVMAIGSLLGGALGGRIASRIPPTPLRWAVVTIGAIVGVIYLLR